MINIADEIRRRHKLIKIDIGDDPVKRAKFIALCKKDILYFFENVAVTDKNPTLFGPEVPQIIPFKPFEFQKEFISDSWEAIEEGNGLKDISYIKLSKNVELKDGTKIAKGTVIPKGTDVFSEKSRQMGFTWIFVWIQIYAFLFHNMKSLYISKKGEEVDKTGDMASQFEKIRFGFRNIPKFMLPNGFSTDSGTDYNKYMTISSPISTGSITGESANPSAGRGGTYAFAIFDEMAFMQYASSINMSVASATPCRFFNSTPNGEGNEYFRMRELATNELIRYHRCFWYENPYYTQEWYDKRIQGMTREQIAQELEIDYNIAIEGRVYTEFSGKTHDIEFDPLKSLYISIDNSHGGADPHAVIVCQIDPQTQFWDIIDCMEINCSVTAIAELFAGEPKMILTRKQDDFYKRYQQYNYKRATFIADPYDTHSMLNQSTIAQEYAKVGIYLNTPYNRKKEEQILKTRTNISKIRVHERCAEFIAAIQNARYPERRESHNSTTPNVKPIHDWTSHYRTGLEYLVTFLLQGQEKQIKRNKRTPQPMYVKNHLTGEINKRYV